MAGATYTDTLNAFTNFLTAYIHTLLYLRTLYPRTSFVHSRFHNASAYQSRHPLVCDWIRDAIDAVRNELFEGTVSRIGIVIFSHGNGSMNGSGVAGSGTGNVQIMERFMIDVSAFPVVDKDDRNAEDEREYGDVEEHQGGEDDPDRSRSESNEPSAFDIGVDTNLAEQMRAALISLTTRCAQLSPLPEKCSFNISMELKDEADVDPPVAHPQAWIPVQPSLQKTGRWNDKRAKVEDEGEDGSMPETKTPEDKRRKGEDLGGVRVTPIRTVETGTFRFETWVEEGRAKFGGFGGKVKGKPKASFSSSGDSITK
ncbi:DNA-binding protein [Macroventuria anomochaeta]|uniref:DNA-binding protein n=1 Tax=Macroventuria anomochaeta TaxID=301207 RepID=A0ACB6SCD3_9PLEO|nr:DNA-binding protein [Macroventuria anomochaeta]KAF2631971.1 DNA-binding protein [Macroventuria anomochaeta]